MKINTTTEAIDIASVHISGSSKAASTSKPISEATATFRRLRELDRQCKDAANLHDCAAVMIAACIEEGFNTRARIVGALKRLDYKQAHIVLTLEHGGEGSTGQPLWRCDAGTYSLVADEIASAS